MYFKKFPVFPYEYSINGKDTAILVTDITRNIRFRRDLLANITVYDEYDIVGDETPEHIAEKLYGNAEYHWIIMLVNERYDYKSDFPLSYVNLQKYAEDKYGSTINDVKYWVNDEGYIVSSDYPGASSISNMGYEELVNESKRRIKIIPEYLISKIISEYKAVL